MLRVDFEAYFVLVLLTNTAPLSSEKLEADFWVILFHGPCLLLCGPYYELLLQFIIVQNNHSLGYFYS